MLDTTFDCRTFYGTIEIVYDRFVILILASLQNEIEKNLFHVNV